MRHLLVFLTAAVLFGLVMIGCDRDHSSDTVAPSIEAMPSDANSDGGLTVVSAVLHVYETLSDSTAVVNAHAITAPWDEHTVTFASFDSAFNPAVVGSFSTAGTIPGWRTVDVTSLVVAWQTGTPNYGILLEQGMAPRTMYHSSEYAADPTLRPKLVITYLTGAGNTITQTLQRGLEGSVVADTYIWALAPNNNMGYSSILYTGRVVDKIKFTLIRFEWVPYAPGCTRTIGYWKNHAGIGRGNQLDMVSSLLPISLGTWEIADNDTAYNILTQRVYGVPSNGITKLYAQLLGAKLNLASGAAVGSIGGVIVDADIFLSTHNWTDWDGLSEEAKQEVLSWQSTLDEYNNGLKGPDHCDDSTVMVSGS